MNMWALNRPRMCTIVIPSTTSKQTSTTAAPLVRISLPSGPPTRQRRPERSERRVCESRAATCVSTGAVAGFTSCPPSDLGRILVGELEGRRQQDRIDLVGAPEAHDRAVDRRV